MLNASTDLHRSQQLLQDADQLITTADAQIAHSKALIARGEARTIERARAAMEYDKLYNTPTQGKTASDS
jgi:hypothetical protein